LDDSPESIVDDTVELRITPDHEGWVQYVLDQFRDGEFVVDESGTRRPKINGLRRVCKKLIGVIVESESRIINHPTANFIAATAEHTLTIRPHGEFDTIRITDVADVYPGNCEAAFARFPSSVAATRAEARTLRKALDLYSIASADECTNLPVEMAGLAWEPEEPISQQQIDTINVMCNRLSVDVDKFINIGKEKYKKIEDVSKGTASKMLAVLNGYQQGKSQIPPKILKDG